MDAVNIIDLSPVINEGLKLLAAFLGVLAYKVWGDGRTRDYLDRALDLGLDFAMAQVRSADWTKVGTRNALLAHACAYVVDAVPGAIKRFGWDRKGLENRLLARLARRDDTPFAFELDRDLLPEGKPLPPEAEGGAEVAEGDEPDDDPMEAARRRARGQSTLEGGGVRAGLEAAGDALADEAVDAAFKQLRGGRS